MTATAFTLRPAVPDDHDDIAAIWHDGASLPGVGPASMPSLAELRQRVDVEFAQGWVVTIAERDGVIVGFIALRPDQAVLDQLFVHPDALGRGLGKTLFAEAVAAMPEGFTLFTRPGNTRACRFYEALGMTVIREEIHPRFGDRIVFYEWTPPGR